MYKICNMYCKASFTSCLKISSISVRRWQSYVRFCDHTHQFALNMRNFFLGSTNFCEHPLSHFTIGCLQTDYSVWGLMLGSYNKVNPLPTSRSELKDVLQDIWDALPHTPIQKAVRSFRKRLQSCVRVEGGHFEHLLK